MTQKFSIYFHRLLILVANFSPFYVDAVGKQRGWLGPSIFITGAPTPRASLGFAAFGGQFYVFGGQGTTGEIHALLAPKISTLFATTGCS